MDGKYSVMKNIKFNTHIVFSLLVMCAVTVSCNSNEGISGEEESAVSRLSCIAVDKEFEGESSRSSLTYSSSGMKFAWTQGDGMTVFAKDDNRATQLYMLEAGSGQPIATFFADNFKLKKDQLYYSFSKIEGERYNTHVVIPDQNNISVDYSGQTQISNASDKHLGDYDFMAAGAIPEDENSAHFSFQHLGSTLRVIMSFNPNAITDADEKAALSAGSDATDVKMVRFTEMEIFDSENSFRQTKRDFSFAAGTNGMNYTFKWPEQEITGMDRFNLTLKKAVGSEEGVSRFDEHVDGTANDGKLISYIEIPPMNFTGKKIGFMIKGYYEKNSVKHPVSYIGTYAKDLNVVNGKAYMINLQMEKPQDFNVTLKVNHMWQHGNSLDYSRATSGDPGYDNNIVTPKYIYYIYCHDGKVVKPTTAADASIVTSITGLTKENWDTKNNDGVWISTFKGKNSSDNGIINLRKPDCSEGHTCTYHLYVVASASELNLTVAENDSEESVVRELKYNLPSSNVQVFMRDFYSTPWDVSRFVGNLTDPMQDVMLYHVAAKVDLKWNSTSAIDKVSVNKVKNENLYIFKPTENVYATGSYTESQTMDIDQQYNGRQVFYLPQFATCKYNVTVGSNTGDITFAPATTNGFTSWLRWLKKF